MKIHNSIFSYNIYIRFYLSISFYKNTKYLWVSFVRKGPGKMFHNVFTKNLPTKSKETLLSILIYLK